MKRIYLIMSAALLLTVVGLTVIAQSETDAVGDDKTANNLEIVRLFRLIDGWNKEADKQMGNGFPKRAERVRNYFQKKTGISDESQKILNKLSKDFTEQDNRPLA